MGKKRIAKWDNVKLVLIVFVVIGHIIATYISSTPALKSLYLFIYTFHMPAFVLLSGMMMKNTIKNKRYEKVFSYFTMGVFIQLLNIVVKWFVLNRKTVDLFDMNNVCWYAFAIFVFAFITMYLQRFSPVYVFIFAVVMSLAAGLDNSIGTYLTISRIFVFYPFFLAGFYIDSEKLLDFSGKVAPKCVSGIVIAATAVICALKPNFVEKFLPLFKGKSSYASLGELKLYGAPLRLAVYVVAFLVSFAVIIIVPNVKSYFTTLGSRTLSIYALHFALIYILRDALHIDRIFKSISPENYMYFSLLVAVVLIIVTSLKPVNFIVTKIINPRILTTEEK